MTVLEQCDDCIGSGKCGRLCPDRDSLVAGMRVCCRKFPAKTRWGISRNIFRLLRDLAIPVHSDQDVLAGVASLRSGTGGGWFFITWRYALRPGTEGIYSAIGQTTKL